MEEIKKQKSNQIINGDVEMNGAAETQVEPDIETYTAISSALI